MKKLSIILICSVLTLNAISQNIISAWRFPSSQLTPDESISINSGRFLGTEDDIARPVFFVSGQLQNDTAAATIEWNDGIATKFWLVKFKTTGYENIRISSKQRSESVNGPKDFLIQWKISGVYANLISDTIHVSDNWTAGVVNDVLLPSDCNNTSTNISVRWLMSSNQSLSNGVVSTSAYSLIDDIIITGTSISSGVTDYIFVPEIKAIPNPSKGNVTIKNLYNISKITVFDISGRNVYSTENILNNEINLENLKQGLYYVNCINDKNLNKLLKVIVQ